MQGRSGIRKINDTFPSKFAGVLPFGEVNISTPAFREKLHAQETGITRTSLMALHAMDEAVKNSGLTREELCSFDTALVGATTVGGMCLIDELYQDANKKEGPTKRTLISFCSGRAA